MDSRVRAAHTNGPRRSLAAAVVAVADSRPTPDPKSVDAPGSVVTGGASMVSFPMGCCYGQSSSTHLCFTYMVASKHGSRVSNGLLFAPLEQTIAFFHLRSIRICTSILLNNMASRLLVGFVPCRY